MSNVCVNRVRRADKACETGFKKFNVPRGVKMGGLD